MDSGKNSVLIVIDKDTQTDSNEVVKFRDNTERENARVYNLNSK